MNLESSVHKSIPSMTWQAKLAMIIFLDVSKLISSKVVSYMSKELEQ